ncbi:TerB family tellurite resistance protein [bacterium]|nr:TerB family tellurite resistance protein [bacterium]MDA8564367.1 TerB family tellurite resistance protein [bacterium]
MVDSKTIELVAFKGSEYSKSSIRNLELYLYYPNYNLEEDLIVIELTNQNERKNYITEKNSSNIKRFFIPKQLINEIDKQFYKFEIYLDKAELTSKEFSNEEILIRCSVLKNYAENATLENLKIDTEKPLFEFPENTIKNKTQIYSTSGRSDKSKIKKLVDTRGIDIASHDQTIQNEKESDDEKQIDIDSDESTVSFDEDFYRIFVNCALILANADGQLTNEEEESIIDLAPTYLNKNKIHEILNFSKMEYQKNNITFSTLVHEINNIYNLDEKKSLLNSLYIVSVSDGKVDPEELRFLELIADNISVDFQSLKRIRRSNLEKVNYQETIEDFSRLEINFNASVGEQIGQAKYQLTLWNSRLAIADARSNSEYQLLINKYSRFLRNLEKQGHKIIDENREKISFDIQGTYRTSNSYEYNDYDTEEDDYASYENYDVTELKKYSKENFPLPPPTTDIRVMEKRIKHKRAYARWSDDEQDFLVFLYDEKEYEFKLIADILQRQVSAIQIRLSDLGFIEDSYDYWN